MVTLQLHDANVHWLELEMFTEHESMRKAKLVVLLEDVLDVQLHDVKVHWLELEIVAGE